MVVRMALLCVLCVLFCWDCIALVADVWVLGVFVQVDLEVVEECVLRVECCAVVLGCTVAASVLFGTVHWCSCAFVDVCDLLDSNWSSCEDSILHLESLGVSTGSTWLTLCLLQETCLSTDDCAKVDEYSLKRSVLLFIYGYVFEACHDWIYIDVTCSSGIDFLYTCVFLVMVTIYCDWPAAQKPCRVKRSKLS